MAEIEEGRYVVVQDRPVMVSALGAIPKGNGSYRLIHDCSRPSGKALNDYVDIDSFSFQTVEEALTLVTPACFLAKIDLKSAYRSVPISQNSQKFTGLSWFIDGKKKYFIDTRLPFGAKASPGIFHRITQSVARMMARRGYHNIRVYLDDFIIIEQSKQECLNVMNVLISLLRLLGFHINWDKVEGPSTAITFLGICINSISMTLSIPSTKILDICESVTQFSNRYRASKKQLQSLVGKLSWVARVVPAGRIYLRSLIQGMKNLKLPQHKVILTRDIRSDLDWWLKAIPLLNDTMLIKDDRPVQSMVMDACTMGCGASFAGDWFYNDWVYDWPETQNLHINYKEVLCTVLAARRWAPLWTNSKIVVYTDSMAAKGMLARARSKNPMVTQYLKELFWLSIVFNFEVIPVHLPGKDNEVADRISRIRDRQAALDLTTVFPKYLGRIFHCGGAGLVGHMSDRVLCLLYLQGCPLIYGTGRCNIK
jgi:hypothetical protein